MTKAGKTPVAGKKKAGKSQTNRKKKPVLTEAMAAKAAKNLLALLDEDKKSCPGAPGKYGPYFGGVVEGAYSSSIVQSMLGDHVVTEKSGSVLVTDSYIGTQVCRSGKVACRGKTTIRTRYIPPGSTCVIDDGPSVVVKQTIHGPAPAAVGGFCV